MALAAALFAALVSAGLAAKAQATPSAVVYYRPTLAAALDQYARPGNVIVVTAEQRSRNPARLRAWRAKGAIVLAYVDAVDWHVPLDPIEQRLYGGAFPSQWFYRGLSNWPGTRMLDLSASCPVATYNGFTGTWGQYVAHYIRNEVIKDGSLFDGVFLDVWGARIWSVGVGGPGTDWEAGVARWGRDLRQLVGPDIFLVANNTQTAATARPLNGRMWEGFESRRSGWNPLTGGGTYPGLVTTFAWTWQRPQLDILWRNEASPSQDVKDMLNGAARRVERTGSDVAVGASNHSSGIPAPFGQGGGVAPPDPLVPVAAPRAGAPVIATGFGSSSLSPWVALPRQAAGPEARKGPIVARRGLVRLVDHAGEPPRGLAAAVAPQAALTARARIKLAHVQLDRGSSRAVLSLGSAGGANLEAGVLRAQDGTLRWALWTAAPSGARRRLETGRGPVRSGTWLNLEVRSSWLGGRAEAHLRVNGRRLLDLRGSAGGRTATRVLLGRGGRGPGTAVVLVDSVVVKGEPA
jgi:hypothetical protein